MDRSRNTTKRTLAQEDAIPPDSPRSATPLTLNHPISPPTKKRRISKLPQDEGIPTTTLPSPITAPKPTPQIIPSPFHLTHIRDLPPSLNHATLSLNDLLNDPLISECWEFNYLHDIDFLMSAFDPDVRHLVKVNVVHGFWKKEDANRLALEAQAAQYENVKLHTAYLPEMFGTHHTKMMVLLRHDETAEVVIHTANMIVRDWGNMTQGIWRSGRLEKLSGGPGAKKEEENPPIGSGERFKIDFLNYLRAYDNISHRKPCRPIIEELLKYNFSSVRGALIGSVPGRHPSSLSPSSKNQTLFGWPALKHAVSSVPVTPSSPSSNPQSASKPKIAIQISSIATLGPTDAWLKNTLFAALAPKSPSPFSSSPDSPSFSIIFPTPSEIRRSLDGYASGGSIHTKIQSPQQTKQLHYLRPMFCHWGNDIREGKPLASKDVEGKVKGKGMASYEGEEGTVKVITRNAGRKRAAPHIKTYIRYSNEYKGQDGEEANIDWALVTSANLSKQAWGEAAATGKGKGQGKEGEVRISSYELGVLVWPELWGEGAVMRGCFGEDTWRKDGGKGTGVEGDGDDGDGIGKKTVSLRMPYNLPLQRYDPEEVPWVATMEHTEPDWKGQVWRGW